VHEVQVALVVCDRVLDSLCCTDSQLVESDSLQFSSDLYRGSLRVKNLKSGFRVQLLILLQQFCIIHVGTVKGQPRFPVKMRKNPKVFTVTH
jgi:hypothetical protein